MIDSLKFHHVGVVTADLDGSLAFYVKLGYSPSPRYDDPIQKVAIILMDRTDGPTVELIMPAADNVPLTRLFARNGAGPYHTCYEVADIAGVTPALKTEGFWPMGQPVPAVAFNGRLVVFLLSPKLGLLELVEAVR